MIKIPQGHMTNPTFFFLITSEVSGSHGDSA